MINSMFDELMFGPVREPDKVDILCKVWILPASTLEFVLLAIADHTNTEVLLYSSEKEITLDDHYIY